MDFDTMTNTLKKKIRNDYEVGFAHHIVRDRLILSFDVVEDIFNAFDKEVDPNAVMDMAELSLTRGTLPKA